MIGKGTGKYYAPVYRAKKSPVRLRRIRLIRRGALIAVAVAVVALSVMAVKGGQSQSDSFVQVAASRQSLRHVSAYPRVVGASSPLESDFVPESLMSLGTVPNGDSVMLRADAAEAFFEMCSAMSEDGLGIVPVRGYVSYDEQSEALVAAADRLMAGGVASDEAMKRAAAEVFAPGEDEAQLGTTVEVSTVVNSVEGFVATEQYKWICANASKYGFIVRYTDAKRKVTGVEAMPWRLRYVGSDAAEFIASTGMCLEEYVRAVKSQNSKAVEEY